MRAPATEYRRTPALLKPYSWSSPPVARRTYMTGTKCLHLNRFGRNVDDLLRDFLTESTENLAHLDQDVVELEREPGNVDLLNSIFRTIHTMKGTCGFLGLERLEAISHTTESVLDRLRRGELTVSSDVISDILRAVDVIKGILTGLETAGAEPRGEDSLLIGMLETWLSPGDGSGPHPETGEALVLEGAVADGQTVISPAAEAQDTSASSSREDFSPPAVPVPAMPRIATGRPNDPEVPTDAASSVFSSSLRISVGVLDALMNLAGELVLTRNQLVELSARDDGSPYVAPVQQLNRITTELQAAVMKTRMQPVGTAWGKLPRIVRDMARDLGKQIELELCGTDTELDRQLLQAIQDPLTHMVRNSADHGIELPHVRRAAGKSETGTIRISAYHESGNVIVEITDDGAGIDAGRVRRKAVERGLVRADVAVSMSDSQILRYVFEPGFSTAEAVTHLSGRGVGMDVVRNNIERVGGTVDLQSVPGRGCTIRIRLPLTLAIVSALLVSAGAESFAIPQSCITELVRLHAETRRNLTELHGVPVYRLRDELVPLLGLSALLNITGRTTDPDKTLVVCRIGSSRFAIVVDDVIDTQEIVVKPIGRRVRHLVCYSGCTILGDGRVIMILDPLGLAAMGGLRTDEVRSVDAGATPPAEVAEQRDALLLFDGGSTAVQAVPLSRVARLEEIPVSRIEQAGGRMVVQYRGGLLPLVAPAGVPMSESQPSAVIVFNEGSRSFGLAVREIRDIVDDTVRLELESTRPGVLGTAVIHGAATEVIDISYFMTRAYGEGA